MEFEFECDSCGQLLDIDVHERKGVIRVFVSPCPECLAHSYRNGFDEGYDEGYDEGLGE